MAAPKRTPTQREYDLERLASLYLKGWRQVDIAAELDITQQQVSYDLKELHRRWRESQLIDINEAKQQELSRIDELERTYWDGWERSQGEHVKIRTESGISEKGEIEDGKLITIGKTVIDRETLVGAPAFLSGVQWCISERCRILGLYAPTKVAPTTPDGKEQYDGASERLNRRIDSLAARIRTQSSLDGNGADSAGAGTA